ncbi:DUF58 domain-containing protein [Halomonas huangheensis]|uniref:DUF58 domain-containing protein n=1 Tax=Halomonas huangheensis TaxID=1178482 RepID=W1N3V1_9GAMM|nr:DUF58 domain-containing protein [Halomonas huangheensis]ALM51705.1 MoxR protein [Halomonas huangheensis]ERL50198.1 hypothetical protein BJB45_03465 [Halomonas huangheensis]
MTQSTRTRQRAGVLGATVSLSATDYRVHVDFAYLRSLESHGQTLHLLPHQPARSVLNGRHGSRLRGRGLDFLELRSYLPSDDIRSIDWRVTARTGEPHVRVFTEERDRPALLVVDQRMSMFFGTRHAMKSVTAAETAALLAFAVLGQNDRIGGLVVRDDGIDEVRPACSRATLMRLLSHIAEANGRLHAERKAPSPTSLDDVLTAVARLARRDHLIIVLSDFDVIGPRSERLLSTLSRHNDIVLAPVADPFAEQLPSDLQLVVSDGDLQATFDTSDNAVRSALEAVNIQRREQLVSWQRKFGLSLVPLTTSEPALPQLRRLLGQQRRSAPEKGDANER